MKYGDAANDPLCEIHYEIQRFLWCEINRIHPFRPAQRHSRPSVDEKMNLMDVKRMNLVCCIRNPPMSVGSYLYPSHRLRIREKRCAGVRRAGGSGGQLIYR